MHFITSRIPPGVMLMRYCSTPFDSGYIACHTQAVKAAGTRLDPRLYNKRRICLYKQTFDDFLMRDDHQLTFDKAQEQSCDNICIYVGSQSVYCYSLTHYLQWAWGIGLLQGLERVTEIRVWRLPD